MTDEFSIQQQRPSALPYLGIGGAVGGTAGYFGLPKIDSVKKWMSEPAKYGSYEEIINEADDTFTKAVEAAEGEEKTLMEKAANARKAGADAAKKYDSDLADYLKNNKDGSVIKDDNFIKLEEELKLKEDALNAKKEELIKQEVENLKKNNTGKLTERQKEVAEKLNKKIEEINTKRNDYIQTRDKNLEKINTTISEPRVTYTYKEFGKTMKAEGNAFEQLMQEEKTFKNTIENVESHIKDGKFKKGSELTFVDPKTKKVVCRVPKNQQEIKAAKAYFEKSFNTKLETMFPGIKQEFLSSILDDAKAVVENNIAINENITTKTEYINKNVTAYQDALKNIPTDADVLSEVKKSAKPGSPQEDLIQRFLKNESEITNLENKIKTTTDPKELKTLENSLKNRKSNAKSLGETLRQTFYQIQELPIETKRSELSTKQLYKNIQRAEELLKKESGYTVTRSRSIGRRIGSWLGVVTPHKLSTPEARELKNLKTLLEEAEANLGSKEYQAIEEKALKAGDVTKEITKLENELKALEDSVKTRKDAQSTISKFEKQIEEWAGKGAHVDSAGNIVKADGSIFKPESSLNLKGKVGAPAKDTALTRFENSIANIRAHIPQEGTLLTEEQILEQARNSIKDDALKAETEARNIAKKAVNEAESKLPKNAAKTTEELTKEFVEKHGTKENAIKEATNGFKDDLAKLFEGRLGKGKLALAVGGAVATGALLGLAFRPGAKEA